MRRSGDHDQGPERKRVRSSSSNDDLPVVGEGTLKSHLVLAPNRRLASQTPEFTPGAILNLRLVNFQVASDSTYEFGPLLNLVLGSNGTGKSTIINALFLLFRGSLASLDRRDYAGFIQHGRETAYVSALIQSKEPAGENLLLAVVLEKSRPTVARWFLNLHPIPPKRLASLLEDYRIQVNNLCQFLSQFRVAAFSGETAQQRLKSTELAVGYPGIVRDHEMLAGAGEELSRASEVMTQRAVVIEKLTQSRAELQEKLQRIEETVNLKQRAALIENAIAVKAYDDMRKEVADLKKRYTEAKKSLAKFDAEMQPYVSEMRTLEGKIHELRTANVVDVTTIKQVFARAQQSLELSQRRVATLTRDITKSREFIVKLDADIQLQEYQLTETRLETSRHLSNLNANGMRDAEYETLQETAARSQTKHAAELKKLRSLTDQLDEHIRQKESSLRSMTVSQDKLQTLEAEVAKQPKSLSSDPNVNYPMRDVTRLREFVRDDRDLVRCVRVIKQSMEQSRVEKSVIMPAVISLSITNPVAARIFSRSVRNDQLVKFVCRSERDQRYLADLSSQANLRLRTTLVSGTAPGHSFNEAELRQFKALGFDGVLTDYLECPPAMMAFLTSLGLSTLLVSFKPLRAEAIQLVRNFAARSAGIRCADPQNFYSFSRSRYGSKQVTESSSKLPHTLDPFTKFMSQHRTIQESLQGRQEKIEEIHKLRESAQRSKTRFDQSSTAIEQLEPTIAQKQKDCDVLQHEAKAHAAQFHKEKALRANLQRSRAEEVAINDSLTRKRAQKEAELTSLRSVVSNLCGEIQTMSTLNEEEGRALPELMTADLRNEKLEIERTDHENQLELLRCAITTQRQSHEKEIAKWETELLQLRSSQQQAKADAQNARSWIREHNKEAEAQQLSEKSIRDLREELHQLQASVTLHDQQSDSLVSIQTRLATVRSQLEEETQQQAEDEARVAHITEEHSEIRERWERHVRDMVTKVSDKFSELFKRVGSSGHVALITPSELNVGTWGIDIYVSFRASEAPQKLSAMRQSGGERSVSTALYLLSLQGLQTAPFRVLDEINQGLDEKNERVVMDYYVDMSCNAAQDDRQQYFLVTPKLILNVPTHRDMNIVFITSGELVRDSERFLKATNSSERDRAIASVS